MPTRTPYTAHTETSFSNRQLLALQDFYQNNYMRHLLALSFYYRQHLMQHLQSLGFSDLKLSWEPFISLPSQQSLSLTQLAQAANISKQYCDQQLKQVEQAGYISRQPHPSDQRQKLIQLTSRGLDMIKASGQFLYDLEQENIKLVSKKNLNETSEHLQTLIAKLEIPGYQNTSGFIPSLIHLARYAQQNLMLLTQERGHPGLQNSYEQVLNHIGLSGASSQQLADKHQLSKQAINRICNELEAQGYISRIDHPQQARTKLIVFASRGIELLQHAHQAMQQQEKDWQKQLSKTKLEQSFKTLAQLYQALIPEQAPTSDNIHIDWQAKPHKPQSQHKKLLKNLAALLPDAPQASAEKAQTELREYLNQKELIQLKSLLNKLTEH